MWGDVAIAAKSVARAMVGLPGLVCWFNTSSPNVLSFGRTTRAGVLVHYIEPQCT